MPVRLLVLWALGASMLVLAGLQFLPRRVLWIIAIAVIAGHNLLDPVEVAFTVKIQEFGGAGVGHWTLDVGGVVFCIETLDSGQIVLRRM